MQPANAITASSNAVAPVSIPPFSGGKSTIMACPLKLSTADLNPSIHFDLALISVILIAGGYSFVLR